MDKLVGFARKKRLGDLLVDAGVISQDQLVKALQVQKTEKQGERLGVVLIDLGFTDEKQIVEALKAQLKIQSIDLSTLRIPEEIIRLLDEAVLRKYNLIPFKFNEKNPNLLCVAMSDPLDIRAMDDVSIIPGVRWSVLLQPRVILRQPSTATMEMQKPCVWQNSIQGKSRNRQKPGQP